MLRLFSALLLLAPPLLAKDGEFSEPAPLAARSLLLDVTDAGGKLVAVGDRGHIVISTDEGRTWQQASVPTRAMLTGVAFADADHGWAVGHDGVIVATTDGGRTWQRQDDGKDLETVYLDVLFLDARRGFVVGAYGKCLFTEDAGANWRALRPTDEDMHFNRVLRTPGGALYLVGEAGTLLRSSDEGRTWERLEVPYEGSLFAGIAPDDDTLVLAGLRGHIFTSRDRGETWQPHDNNATVLISASTRTRDGLIVLAGQGGNFFLSRDGGRSFRHWKPAQFGTSIAELVPISTGVVSVGEAGAVQHTLPSP
jgi:photosystem II stability/assembly factor-like uncharacterized protein